MKNILNVWQRPSDAQWWWGSVLASAALLTVLMIGCTSGKQDLKSEAPILEIPVATSTPETPPLTNAYPIDEQPLEATKTYSLCRMGTAYIDDGTTTTFENVLNCWSQLQQGDVVQVTGKPQIVVDYYGEHGWYWPVRVLQGGIYAEDGFDWLIADSDRLYPTVLGERPVPDFEVGETVLLGYNFLLHSSPAGSPILDSTGRPITVLGHWSAVITDGPSLTDGRYWYQVAIIGLNLPPGWVPPEFQKTG